MTRFLSGLAIGFGASCIALVSILGAYNPPVVPEWESTANAISIYLVALVAAALIALIWAMARVGMFDVVFPRRRRPAAPSANGRSETERLYR